MDQPPHAIQTDGLTKWYSGWFRRQPTHAVTDLNLHVPRGCTYGFLGHNGAGKTTTIKMLLGLVRPTRGGGTVLGEPLGDEKAKRRVGFLPEEPSFARHLSARAFLDYCARLSQIEFEKRAKRIDEMLELVGLSNHRHKKLGAFSRGMLERIGIAQALLHDPELLILDEPMTGLDPTGRHEVKRILQRLTESGKTLFFSSHILPDVEELCDWVGVLREGELVKAGPIDQLLAHRGATIHVAQLPTELLERVTSLVDSIKRNGEGWSMRTDDDAKTQAVLTILREGGCTGVRSEPLRQNLEAMFLETLSETKQLTA